MLYLYESSSPLPTLSLPLRSATISASTRKTPGVDVQGASKDDLLTLLPQTNHALSASRILSLLCKAKDWEDEVVPLVTNCTIALTATRLACLNRAGKLLWRCQLSTMTHIASSSSTTFHIAWQSQSSFGAVVTFNSSKEAEGFSAAVKGAAPKLSFVGLQSKSASDPRCGAEQ